MKKIMILGASILQLPAILKAREMELQVIAVDMDKNAIGFKYADVCLEISTIDIPKVVEAAIKYQIDGVMTLASDMPMRTVAEVSSKLNIVGISNETAFRATNKALMRECLRDCNVPIPIFYRVNDFDSYLNAIQRITGNLIVKPADSSGSRGVFLLENKKDNRMIEYAFEYSKMYSYSGDIVVEEYMEGPEVSVETLSVDGKVHIIGITDKLTTGAPRFVEMGHSQPSLLSEHIKKQIKEVTIEAVRAIGIENGPSHTEIIVTSNGPKIVEIGARLGGDNITTHLVPLSAGIDMVKCCIEIALGQNPSFEKKLDFGSAIRYFDVPAGRIINIEGLDEARELLDIQEIVFTKNIGAIIGEFENSIDRVGYVIAQSSTAIEAIRSCEKALNLIKINLSTIKG